jgi:hypothetical protein
MRSRLNDTHELDSALKDGVKAPPVERSCRASGARATSLAPFARLWSLFCRLCPTTLTAPTAGAALRS